MSDRIPDKYLAGKIGRKFIIVTSDGGAYMGTLEEFDGDFIVLGDVFESTTSTSLMWHRVKLEYPIVIENSTLAEEKKEEILMKRVIINLRHIIRIWLIDG